VNLAALFLLQILQKMAAFNLAQMAQLDRWHNRGRPRMR
jgi:hypothetical protein